MGSNCPEIQIRQLISHKSMKMKLKGSINEALKEEKKIQCEKRQKRRHPDFYQKKVFWTSLRAFWEMDNIIIDSKMLFLMQYYPLTLILVSDGLKIIF